MKNWLIYFLLATVLVPLTLTAQAQSAPPRAAPADSTFYAVSYIEVTASPSSKAVATMAVQRYGESNRTQDGFLRAEAFEQIGRPGHYVVIETWRDEAAFNGRPPTVQMALLAALQAVRVSDYDQRPYKVLTVGPAWTAKAAATAVSVISHVDVAPDPRVAGLLTRLAEVSRQESGNLRFDVMQHTMRANHFTVIETWRNQQALDAHVAAAHTRLYRNEIQPMTGSPLDERVFKVVE